MESNNENELNHWCAELFPPTFTREDILEVSVEAERVGGLPKDYYTDVYSQVVLEEELKERRRKGMRVAQHKDPKKEECSISEAPAATTTKTSNLWSGEELQVFRKAYIKLKEKAVKLLCIIETKNLKINDLKKENVLMKKQLKQKDVLIADLIKEKTIFQGYTKSHEKICSELEYKLQFYEDCNNDLKEVILRKDEELRKTKSELLTQKEVQKRHDSDVSKLNREHKLEIISLEERLRAQHESDIVPLRKEIGYLMSTKQSCEEQCNQFKKSFLDLQKHFMEGKVSSQGHVDRKEGKEFLGITDLN